MIELDISKFIPGAGGGPRAVFREDPDMKKAKEIGLVMTASSVVVVILAAIAVYLIANNWQVLAANSDEELRTATLAINKYRADEKKALNIANLSSAAAQAINSKTYWTLFFNEISRLTPKNVVYSSFTAGGQSAQSLSEQATGLAVGSFSGTMADLLKLNGADRFLFITRLKIDQGALGWTKLTEDQKIVRLADAMKQPAFWSSENIEAANSIDERLKLGNGKAQELFSQGINMVSFLRELAGSMQSQNEILINGITDSYLDVAKLVVSYSSSELFSDIRLSSVSLREDNEGNPVASFSIRVSFKGDLRTLGKSISDEDALLDTDSMDASGGEAGNKEEGL